MSEGEDKSRAQAWSLFWSEQGDASRCLGGVHPDVHRAIGNHWAAFAATLAPDARVLDIGCGAGIVAREMLAARTDLRITGIDLATIPPSADRRIRILSGTAMESLPFDAASFDAAVSQFGFEYGRTEQAAKALAHVLAPGAPFSFLVHHSQSSVLDHNRARSRALRALGGERMKAAFLAGDAAALGRELAPLTREHPGEMLVAEAARIFQSRIGQSEAQRAAIWHAVADALLPECEILGALEASCVAPEALDDWLAAFAEGYEIILRAPMRKVSGEAIAWKIEGVRKRDGA